MAEMWKTIRDEFSILFNSNKEIERIYKKIANSTATYEEAQAFAGEVGKILGKVLDTFNSYDEEALYIISNMLEQNVKLVDAVCDVIQGDLNDFAEIGIKPVAPSKEVSKSRIKGIIEKLQETPETKSAALNLQAETLTRSMVDEWVKVNAKFDSDAGLNPIIVRKWSGSRPSHDTKHTDWCEGLAGTYDYYDTPRDVYKRHEGCRCTVAYYPDATSRARITALAKGEVDKDQVLWNTGRYTSNSREAILRRRRKEFGKEEARKILNEEWKGGFNGNAERHFT